MKSLRGIFEKTGETVKGDLMSESKNIANSLIKKYDNKSKQNTK
jgi:hypothetical protein